MSDIQPLPAASHPYAVRLYLTFGSDSEINLADESARLPFASGLVVQVTEDWLPGTEKARYWRRLIVDLLAFDRASEADRVGMIFAQAMLWMAISNNVSLKFNRLFGQLPYEVYNRTRSGGLSGYAEGVAFWRLDIGKAVADAESAYARGSTLNNTTHTSMQFYASSRMEASPTAKLLWLITALEALSTQREYEGAIVEALNEASQFVKGHEALANEDMQVVRESLANRIMELRRESVRQAIKRLVKEWVSDADAPTLRFIDEVYGKRSKLLHEGVELEEIQADIVRLERILRTIYQSMLGLPLEKPM